jgi:GTPase SAR1 family protein
VSELNQGQKEAADAFFEFLFSDAREFNISGPGGVGKTHLMSHMIDQIMPRYLETCRLLGIDPRFTDVHMTATTNKAAEVLAVATQRPTSTIHSFLNLKVTEDYNTGVSKLAKIIANWRVYERKILFIDEASMIDGSLDNLLQEATFDCKIVYVGDHCQLFPVAGDNPIYRREMPFYELTEPMRTDNPALLAINQQLRETVQTGIFKPIQLVPGSIDLLDDDQMQAKLIEHFSVQNYGNRILAYTNNRVVQYNDFIRQIRQLPDEYTVGENLVNNSAIQLNRYTLSVEEEVTVSHLSENTTDIFVDTDNDGNPVHLTVRAATLESRIGGTFTGIPIPVDRSHFAALLKYYGRIKNWPIYYHLKKTIPDLRMRDAATIHKAQGSTYDTVFIDLGNLSTCHQPNQVARMLYVAFSRAKTRVYLYGQLAAKYGGLTR